VVPLPVERPRTPRRSRRGGESLRALALAACDLQEGRRTKSSRTRAVPATSRTFGKYPQVNGASRVSTSTSSCSVPISTLVTPSELSNAALCALKVNPYSKLS